MNKVMTRNSTNPRGKGRPSGRPPVRHDSRRPGGTPRRTAPGQGTARGTAPGDRTPGTAPTPRTPALAPEQGTPVTAPPPTRGRAATVPQPRPTDLFADRLLSVLSGQRPVHSMLRHTVGRAYDELARLAERGPLRTRGTRPVVRDIGYYVPRPGAIEAFARIGAGDQLRAMAFRLECGSDHRWRCTAVELGGPRTPQAEQD